MALALVVLWDLAIRWPWRDALWGSAGAVPAGIARQFSGYSNIFPLDSPWVVGMPPGLLLGVLAAAALGLLLGWRARLMTAVLFIGLVALHLRNPITQQRGDALLRVMLFWSIFLPLGRHWVVGRRKAPPAVVSGLAPAAFVLQLLAMYGFSMLTKLNTTWIGEGSGVHLALHLDQLVRPLGVILRQHVTITQGLTWLTMLVELLLPLLVLASPRPRVRLIAIGIAVVLHLGFGSMLRLGTFEAIPLACWLALLPGAFWNSRRSAALEPVERISTTSMASMVIVPAIVFCTWLNLAPLSGALGPPRAVRIVAGSVGLDQRWTMFAPRPTVHDGWWMARAVYEDGQERDLLRDGASMTWSPPRARSTAMPTQHWRKYFLELWYPWRRQYRPPLARWFCEGHQLPHDTVAARPRPARVELWFSLEESQWPGGPKPVVPLLMEHRWCTADSTLPPPMPQPVVPGLLPPPPPPS